MNLQLGKRSSGGGAATETQPGSWRLEIPAGPAGQYRLAQLDDYMNLPRRKLPWRAPLRFELQARVSTAHLPGTWGFGLWNDPFAASLGLKGMASRLPSLPNAAWFFYAGAQNYLALRDDHPAQGFLAATFRAPRIPSLLLAPGAVALPLLAVRPLAALARRAAARLVNESAALVPRNPLDWRAYRIDWHPDRVVFSVDGEEVFRTAVSPRPPLGLVLWIDNQYAAFPPSGRLSMGADQNPTPAWLEIRDIAVTE